MASLTQGYMKTPGGRTFPVNIINPKHPVRQAGHTFQVPLVDESGIAFIGECAKECVDRKKDCMILWTGDRGSGKSTGIIKTARYIDPSLTEDNIAFYLEEFTKKFSTNGQGDGDKGFYPQIILDEAGYALYGMEWLNREQRIIAKNMIINRIMRQIIHTAVPKRKQFNNQIRDMAYMWVHISEPQEFVQGYAIVRLAPKHLQSEFHSEKYWEPKMAFIYTEETGELWDRYEAKKIAFVKQVSEETASNRGARGGRQAEGRDRLMKEYYQYRSEHGDPITYEKLGELAGLRTTQAHTILNSEG